MTQKAIQGLTMSNWHKCPNALVDRLMGNVLSPSATCVVLTIWRLTEGVRERHQAAIPTETFMRITGTNRKKTAYQYVNEALDSGLVLAQKERGKVNIYSINKDCPLWYSEEVGAESATTLQEKEVGAETASSGDNCHIVGAEIDPSLDESRGGKRHTYKDIVTKDNIKEKKKEKPKPRFDALTYPIPSFIKQENWNDFVAMRKEIKKPLTETAAKRLISKLTEFDANGFDANESLDYSIMGQYQGVFERNRKQQSNNQVNNYEQPKQSQSDSYNNMLEQQYNERYGQPAEQAVGDGYCGNVYDMEENL